MKIQVKSRFNASVIFEHEAEENSLKITLEFGVKAGAHLEGAHLRGADLEGAYLRGAYLRGADLRGAHLEGADLRGADLEGAYLRGAYLEGADLRGADLEGADLRGADLEGAYLRGADLRGAHLEGEKLTKTPLQLNNLKWFVLLTTKYIRIGCQRFTHDEWRNFTDEEIVKMDFGALKFWRQWKAPIMALADAHAADEKGE